MASGGIFGLRARRCLLVRESGRRAVEAVWQGSPISRAVGRAETIDGAEIAVFV